MLLSFMGVSVRPIIVVKLAIILIGLASLLLSGCASVPMASMDQDAQAKDFSTHPDKGSLYIYRNEILGAAIPMTVVLNGKKLGQTASKTYFQLDLVPGEYSIESVTENTSSLSLSIDAAQNYFVWQEVKMGMWMARSKLQEVDEETGKKGVLESKLIKSELSEDDLLPLGQVKNHPQPKKYVNSMSFAGTVLSVKKSFSKRKLNFCRSYRIFSFLFD